MIIEATYYKYGDPDITFSGKRIQEYSEDLGIFETESECFAYLCQKAWEERELFEDIQSIEILCY